MTHNFNERPTALVTLQTWYSIRSQLDVTIARWRLRKQNETVGERVVLDTVAAARHGIHSVKRLFNGEVSLSVTGQLIMLNCRRKGSRGR